MWNTVVHTEDDHSGCGAASLGYDVAGQTRVVARVGQTRLVDDEVVVGSGVNVVVGQGANQLLVFQPLHLHERVNKEQRMQSDIKLEEQITKQFLL